MPDHFDLIAPLYDRMFQGQGASRLRELLQLPASGWILDAAGGTGRVAQALCDGADGVVVTDLSWGMLRQARGKPGLALVNTNVERLPFPDGMFARVLVVDAFHHLGDQQAAARELVRVLAPGGRLVIEEPDIRRWPVKLVALAERLMLMRSRFLPPAALVDLFSGLGVRAWYEADETFRSWIIAERPSKQ